MLKIIYKKTTLLVACLMFCMINVKTIATDYKMSRTNYEQIYKLRLKWAIEDLYKDIEDLYKDLRSSYKNLENLNQEKNRISNTIEQLKKEKFLSYHINNVFGTLYSKPRPYKGKSIPAALDWHTHELTRFISAYGLLPITVPLAAGYVVKEWLSKKNNDDTIAELEKDQQKIKNDQQKITAEIQKIQPIIEPAIAHIKQKITELETEATELKDLDNFIATYKPK